eukprot:COSAG02_NODE_4341_length_5478_cov_14.459007_5_plen_90_part_00
MFIFFEDAWPCTRASRAAVAARQSLLLRISRALASRSALVLLWLLLCGGGWGAGAIKGHREGERHEAGVGSEGWESSQSHWWVGCSGCL